MCPQHADHTSTVPAAKLLAHRLAARTSIWTPAGLIYLTQGQCLSLALAGEAGGGTPLGLRGYLPPLDDHNGVWPPLEPSLAHPMVPVLCTLSPCYILH